MGKLVAIACCLLLSGCVAAGPQQFAKLAPVPGARVGFVNLLEPELTSVHLGLTAFGNFNNRLKNDWNLPGFAEQVARQSLLQANYSIVDVRLDEETLRGVRARDDQTHMNFSGLERAWIEKYRDILRANNLSALVILREDLRNAAPNGGLPFHGYGLMSFFIGGLGNPNKKPMMFMTAYADVIGGEPPHRSTGCTVPPNAKAQHVNLNVLMSEFLVDPAELHVDDLAKLQASDLAPLRPRFEKLIERRIRGDLASSGLLLDQSACQPVSN